ncbi:MAG UNVERIFIED_CONTAM: aminotransferase class V-fold PLP-dependent enzyme [Rickettsiaceae bacterium]
MQRIRAIINVDKTGLIDIDELENTISKIPEKSLISVIYANNETGAIQDIKGNLRNSPSIWPLYT